MPTLCRCSCSRLASADLTSPQLISPPCPPPAVQSADRMCTASIELDSSDSRGLALWRLTRLSLVTRLAAKPLRGTTTYLFGAVLFNTCRGAEAEGRLGLLQPPCWSRPVHPRDGWGCTCPGELGGESAVSPPTNNQTVATASPKARTVPWLPLIQKFLVGRRVGVPTDSTCGNPVGLAAGPALLAGPVLS